METHIVAPNIDRKYFWNEWDLRRQALMLVNLKNKKTHSTQTDDSHFRRDSEAQSYAQKQQNTQTMRSSSTNVPRTVHYLKGLRHDKAIHPKGIYEKFGEKRYAFKVVDLTIDHDGEPKVE